jgi:hypothetical protein
LGLGAGNRASESHRQTGGDLTPCHNRASFRQRRERCGIGCSKVNTVELAGAKAGRFSPGLIPISRVSAMAAKAASVMAMRIKLE